MQSNDFSLTVLVLILQMDSYTDDGTLTLTVILTQHFCFRLHNLH